MKNKKLLGILSLSLIMGLVACGPKPTSSSVVEPGTSEVDPSTPAPSTPAPSTPAPSTPAPSTPAPSTPAPSTPAPSTAVVEETGVLTRDTMSFVEKDGKLYLKVTGTATNFKEAKLKFAWGFADKDDVFAIGSATPADEDYKHEVEVKNGAYEALYNLTDSGLPGGVFIVYVGVAGEGNYGSIATDGVDKTLNDVDSGVYKYHLRDDEEFGGKAAIALDNLPPYHLTEASVYAESGERTGAWLKVGGEMKDGATFANIEKIVPWINFQNVGNWSNTTFSNNKKTEAERFFYSQEGTKAFLHIDLTSLASGNYNTHLNAATNASTADCKMETYFVTKYYIGDKSYELVSIENGEQGNDGFWGNLGVRIADLYVNKAAKDIPDTDLNNCSRVKNAAGTVEAIKLKDSTSTITLKLTIEEGGLGTNGGWNPQNLTEKVVSLYGLVSLKTGNLEGSNRMLYDGSTAKYVITANGEVAETPYTAEEDITPIAAGMVKEQYEGMNDSGDLCAPIAYRLADVKLVIGENTIVIQRNAGNGFYFFGVMLG